MKPNILAIIPARGGSKTIPRKNIRLMFPSKHQIFGIAASAPQGQVGITLFEFDGKARLTLIQEVSI